jgi:hypothetical protein
VVKKVGILALGAKPPHAGHWSLINIVSKECDEVMLFVSLNDRKRPNEVEIYGKDMEMIWSDYIEPSLPKNVKVVYVSSDTPVRKVYEFLGQKNEDGSDDTYVIYSDPADMNKSFSSQQLQKYLNDLYVGGKIVLEPVNRSETVDISGTKMRKFLASGMKDEFIDNLPSIIQSRGESIWAQLQISIATKSKPVVHKKNKMFRVK